MGLLVFLGSCKDDGPVTPKPFQVVIEVTDPGGAPVTGLQLGTALASPFYMDGKRSQASEPDEGLALPYPVPFYPTVLIEFSTVQAGTVGVVIEDVAGDPIRQLSRDGRPAGVHTMVWNGRDEDQEAVPSGVYYAHVTRFTGSGTMLLDTRRPMLMAAFYADQALIGTTDDQGRIVLSDERLFPYLFDVEPFPATNEIGETVGEITLTPAMRFYLTDPGSGRTVRYDTQVTGPTTLHFIWDPSAGYGSIPGSRSTPSPSATRLI